MTQSSTVHEHNCHSTKQEFIALKWAIAEQFQEYLLWKPFVVKTDNNLLTYIITTPYLNATQHHLVESLTVFTFSIKYQKGWNNAATDALSQVTLRLDMETVKSILDGVTVGSAGKADAHNPVVAETDEEIHKQVWEAVLQARTTYMHVSLHVTDWVAAQWEDPVLKTMINWIPNWKVQDLNTEEGMAILQDWEKLMLYQEALYHHHTPAGELGDVMQFVVPTAYPVAAMNGCHRAVGHKGQQ